MGVIREMLGFSFIIRALIVGSIISLCAALLGVSLVLKRYAMIGDGLSHVGFGTLAVATSFGLAPLPISITVSLIASILLLKLGSNNKLKISSDSAIAIVGSGSLAIGVAAVSMTTGMSTDICNLMFGSILAMSAVDMYISIGVGLVVLTLYIVYYRKIFSITFDEEFAKSNSLNVRRYTTLIAVLTSLTIVIGMRMMGTMLISSIIIFPAVTSMILLKSFKSVVISSAIISILSFLIGMYLAYVANISTGASIVLVNIAFFIGTYVIKVLKGGMR